MNANRLTRVLAVVLGLSAASAGTVSAQQDCFVGPLHNTHLHLPDDEDRVELTLPVGSLLLEHATPENLYSAGCPKDSVPPPEFVGDPMGTLDSLSVLSFSGSGMIEVGIFVTADFIPDPTIVTDYMPPRFQVSVDGRRMVQHADMFVYREIVTDPDRARRPVEWLFDLYFAGSAQYGGSRPDLSMMRYNPPEAIESFELTLVLNRIEDHCTMSASISGDLSGHTFGDVAYFNTAAYPVKKGMMVGTIGETQTHEIVDGFGTVDVSREGALDLAAQLGFISEEEAEEAVEDIEDEEGNQQEAQAESGGFAEWAEQQLRADNPDDGDNFGLNLVDIKADVTPKHNVGAAAMFSGAFTMSISGRVGQAKNQHRIVVVPSLVMATVGISDKGGDRISFELIEGNPLSIDGVKVTNDFIIGTIKGELETKGPYILEGVTSKPRKLKINVVAHFGARRGSLSCMR